MFDFLKTDCSIFCRYKQGFQPCTAPQSFLETKCVKKKRKEQREKNEHIRKQSYTM